MKKSLGVICALSLSLGGCQALEADIDHSGGTVGYYADNIIPGSTKELQLYRAAFAFAFLSRLGAVTIGDRTEARAFLFRMQAVSSDINRLGGHLQTGVADCKALATANADCTQLFESDLPQLEGHLFKLAVASVPQDQLSDIWDELEKADYIAAIWTLTKVSGQEIAAAHSSVAVWRSEREIFSEVLSAAGGGSDCTDPSTNVDNATKCIDALGKTKTSTNDPFAASFVKTPVSGPINAFYDMVQQSCLRLKPIANATPGSEASETTVLNCGFQYSPKANDYSDSAVTTAAAGTQPQAQPVTTTPATSAGLKLGAPLPSPPAKH